MNKVKLKSPAKVNLYLRILGRRPNGYHDLVTLFHRISLCDDLILKKTATDFSFSSNAKLPAREGNLLYKAYLKLKEEVSALGGIHAKLIKKIPIGAGLGGGSSNAAFFLIGIKKIYGLKISSAKLLKIAAKVGADVPFFMKEETQALAWGIGEKMRSVAAKKPLYFLMIPSKKSLSTPAVYAELDRKPGKKSIGLKKEKSTALRLAELYNQGKDGDAALLCVNDLEQPAFRLRKDIEQTLQTLRKVSDVSVMMSGSGPTVFAVSSSHVQIQKTFKRLPQKLRKRAIFCESY